MACEDRYTSLSYRNNFDFTSALRLTPTLLIRGRLPHSFAPNTSDCNNFQRLRDPNRRTTIPKQERRQEGARRAFRFRITRSKFQVALDCSASSEDGSLIDSGSNKRVPVRPHTSTTTTSLIEGWGTASVTSHRCAEGCERKRKWRWETKEVGVCEESSRDRTRHFRDNGEIRKVGTM